MVAMELYPTDRESLERDSDISFFTAGGPGGQNRNRVATGVRLVHRPSGIVAAATERRSQLANRDIAFERLAAKLEAAQTVQAPRYATRPSKASRLERRDNKQQRSAVKKLRRARPEE